MKQQFALFLFLAFGGSLAHAQLAGFPTRPSAAGPRAGQQTGVMGTSSAVQSFIGGSSVNRSAAPFFSSPLQSSVTQSGVGQTGFSLESPVRATDAAFSAGGAQTPVGANREFFSQPSTTPRGFPVGVGPGRDPNLRQTQPEQTLEEQTAIQGGIVAPDRGLASGGGFPSSDLTGAQASREIQQQFVQDLQTAARVNGTSQLLSPDNTTVFVTAENGAVLLRGTVNNESQRQLIEAQLQSQGVTLINNQLQVVDPVTQQIVGEITETTGPAFTQGAAAALDPATQAAFGLPATSLTSAQVSSINQFITDLRQATLAGGTRQVFSPLNNSFITVTTEGGAVLLRGTVTDPVQASVIESRVRALPGVTTINNQLQVSQNVFALSTPLSANQIQTVGGTDVNIRDLGRQAAVLSVFGGTTPDPTEQPISRPGPIITEPAGDFPVGVGPEQSLALQQVEAEEVAATQDLVQQGITPAVTAVEAGAIPTGVTTTFGTATDPNQFAINLQNAAAIIGTTRLFVPGGTSPIIVSSSGGAVLLRGTVATEQQLNFIEAQLRNNPNITTINNQLQVSDRLFTTP